MKEMKVQMRVAISNGPRIACMAMIMLVPWYCSLDIENAIRSRPVATVKGRGSIYNKIL